jgi:hypothetical protein
MVRQGQQIDIRNLLIRQRMIFGGTKVTNREVRGPES